METSDRALKGLGRKISFSKVKSLFSDNKICKLYTIFTCKFYYRGKKMSCYSIKSHNPCDYMTIEQETDEGYVVKITRELDGYTKVTTDFLDKELFESCIRTGYLTKIENVQTVVA